MPSTRAEHQRTPERAPRSSHGSPREGKDNPVQRKYAKRAGIEGTLSRSVRTCEVRRSRYVGLAKTHAQHLLTATSLNFLRVGEWLADVPRLPPALTVRQAHDWCSRRPDEFASSIIYSVFTANRSIARRAEDTCARPHRRPPRWLDKQCLLIEVHIQDPAYPHPDTLGIPSPGTPYSPAPLELVTPMYRYARLLDLPLIAN